MHLSHRLVVPLSATLWAFAGCIFSPAELAQGPGFEFTDVGVRSPTGGETPAVLASGTCIAGTTIELSSEGVGGTLGASVLHATCEPEGTFEAWVPIGYNSGEVEICTTVLEASAISATASTEAANCRTLTVVGVCESFEDSAATQGAEFVFGSGARGDPWVICTTDDFQKLAHNDEGDLWGSHFLLGEDLDFELAPVNPVGTSLLPFVGSFQGYDHYMANITVGFAAPAVTTITYSQDTAVFGYVGDDSTEIEHDVIMNLHLQNVQVPPHTGDNVAALAGTLHAGTIRGCTVSASAFTVAGQNWGGLIGQMLTSKAALRNSIVYDPTMTLLPGTVLATISIGGAVGRNDGGQLSDLRVRGQIRIAPVGTSNGATRVGGLLGHNTGSVTSSVVQGTCETTSNTLLACIVGSSQVGGLIGRNSGTVESSGVELSPAAHSNESAGVLADRPWVKASGSMSNGGYVGGLIGRNINTPGTPAPEVSYSSAQVARVSAVTESIGETLLAGNVGGLVGSHLAADHSSPGLIHDCRVSGAVGQDAPMSIHGAGNTGGLVGITNAPISKSSTWVSIDLTEGRDVGGLVGSTTADVSQCDSQVFIESTGGLRIGGLIGHASPSTRVTDSRADGTVIATEALVGGLIGWLEGSLENCDAKVDVTGMNEVGGLIGRTFNSDIGSGVIVRHATADGVITGDTSVGGLIGVARGEVTYSHSIGTVSGDSSVGGLLGSTTAVVTDSWADVAVSGDTERIGGLIGSAAGGSTTLSEAKGNVAALTGSLWVGGLIGLALNSPILECNSSGDIAADGENIGGLVGATNRKVEKSWATGTVIGLNHVGGLVGLLDRRGSVLEGVVRRGDVMGCRSVGGLVGRSEQESQIDDSLAEIAVLARDSLVCGTTAAQFGGAVGTLVGQMRRSISRGNVVALVSEGVGGLVGVSIASTIDIPTAGHIEDCYSESSVEGGDFSGALVGAAVGNPIIERSFALGELIKETVKVDPGLPLIGGFLGNSTTGPAEIANCVFPHGAYADNSPQFGFYLPNDGSERSFAVDFQAYSETVWKMIDGQSYPILKWE